MADDVSASRRSAAPLGIAAALLLALLGLGFLWLWLAHDPGATQTDIPRLPRPDPIQVLQRHPLDSPLRLRLTDVRLATDDGTRISAAEATVISDIDALLRDTVRLRMVRLRDGTASRAGEADRAFDVHDLDLLLEEVLLDGRGPVRMTGRGAGAGEYRGQTIRLAPLAGSLRRSAGRTRLDLSEARLHLDGSQLDVTGGLAFGPRGLRSLAAYDLRVHATSLEADALRDLGLEVPLDGRSSGELALDGAAERLVVDVDFTRLHEQRLSRVRATGTVAAVPDGEVDLDVRGVPVVLGDSTFEARVRLRGPLDSLSMIGDVALVSNHRVSARLDIDLLRLLDDPRAAGTADLALDPRVLGLRPGDDIRVRVDGSFRAATRALDGALALDSLPLALLPAPDAVQDVGGFARARLRLTGTVDAPVVAGTIGFRGEARVPAQELEIANIQGSLRIGDGVIRADRVRARTRGGTVTVTGQVVPGTVAGVRVAGAAADAAPALDLTVEADSIHAVDDDEAQLTLDGRLHLGGSPAAPFITGRVRPSGWLLESFLAAEPGLDLDQAPYSELAERAPWPSGGRFRGGTGVAAPGAAAESPPDDLLDRIRGRVVVAVDHGFELRDEDSELRGTGEVVVEVEDGEVVTAGVVGLEEGFYAQFGERFRVYGGALVFDGPGLRPRVALRSDYDDEAPLIGGNESPTKPERFPPVQFFGYGHVGEPLLESITRYTLVPWTQLELARLLLLDNEPTVVGGWRERRVWRAEAGADLVGERAIAQGVPLAWSFVGDRLYDFVPIHRAYLRTAVITVGSSYPGRVVVAPLMRGAVVVGQDLHVRIGQPFLTEPPEVVAVYRHHRLRLEAFTGRRFYAGLSLGGDRHGYHTRPRTGVGVRWRLP